MDEDEIEFLDSVLEKTRAEEERVKRETAEGLELFRRQQDEADKKARRVSDATGPPAEEAISPLEDEQWAAAGRKRKRAKHKEGLKGVKVRRSSTNGSHTKTADPAAIPPLSSSPGEHLSIKSPPDGAKPPIGEVKNGEPPASSKQASSTASTVPKASSPSKSGLGLVDYGSDDDDN